MCHNLLDKLIYMGMHCKAKLKKLSLKISTLRSIEVKKINILMKTALAIGLCAVVFSSIASDRPHRGPSPAAISACAGKTAGADCSFTGHANEPMTGTCRQGPKGAGELACRPKPPQAAFDACTGKNAGDACSFTGRRNNTVNGACRKGPQAMVCAPKHHAQQLPDQETDTEHPAE